MILSHLCLPIKTYEKGEYIYRVGDSVRNIGIVVSGSVCIENVDIVGNKSVLAVAQSGEIFAEAYACVENQPILVDVVAAERCEILFLCVERLFDGKTNCTCKDKIIKKSCYDKLVKKHQAVAQDFSHFIKNGARQGDVVPFSTSGCSRQ